MATDLAAVVVAVSLAQFLRFEVPAAFPSSFEHRHYTGISALIAAVWMAALAVTNSRSPRVLGFGAEEYRRVWVATLATFGGIAIVSMLFKLKIARGYLLIALPIGLVLLLLLRRAARQALMRARGDGRCITRVLAVGSADAVRELTKFLDRAPWAGYSVVGACIPERAPGTELDIPGRGAIPAFGDESQVVAAVTATGSQAVAVAGVDRLHGRGIRDLSWELEKLDVELMVSPGVVDVAGPRLQMRPIAGLPLIQVDKPRYRGATRLQKRLFDVGFAGVVLLVCLPLLAGIALAIIITSSGSLFARQEHIGLDGRTFQLLKFRTVVDGADTPVGRFLRRHNLDEIPQFINVLTGDMSVVGPRPPLAGEVRRYDDHARRRLLVRPGITGLWQISRDSELSWEDSWDDSVRLDLYYVENWSMMADLVIAVKTARAVFCHRAPVDPPD